jgi:hypothetical protein
VVASTLNLSLGCLSFASARLIGLLENGALASRFLFILFTPVLAFLMQLI